jgi:hypothetical protein
MPTDGSDYYNRFTSEDKKMSKKRTGNWKPLGDVPPPGEIVGTVPLVQSIDPNTLQPIEMLEAIVEVEPEAEESE